MIGIIEIIMIAFSTMSIATILLRIIAPLTKNKLDNKILKVLNWILTNVSLDSKGVIAIKLEGEQISIPLKKK